MDDNFDIHPHQVTWRGFCKLIGYSAAAIMVILALMAIFLT